jgi:hypothetical protein
MIRFGARAEMNFPADKAHRLCHGQIAQRGEYRATRRFGLGKGGDAAHLHRRTG